MIMGEPVVFVDQQGRLMCDQSDPDIGQGREAFVPLGLRAADGSRLVENTESKC
jgi:hypothetical protein